MSKELQKIIARRYYFSAEDETRVPALEVELGAPLPSPHAADEFMCSFLVRLRGAGEIQEKSETVYGIDELQALQLALGHLEATLVRLSRSLGLRLRWMGDEDGDLGIRIPRFHDE